MKKLFTLVALLAMVLGANAQGGSWEKVYSIDYTTYQGFPFYVMGFVPEFDNGCMTDYGANYRYAEVTDEAEETSDVIVTTQGGAKYYRWTEGGGWHQYFIADGIPTKIAGKYKVIAKVKASNACTININMGWSWSEDPSSASVNIPGDSEFQEVEWQYATVNGSSCNLVAQPGGCTETIEWESLEVYEWTKEGQRPKVWLEDIENGDAEKTWAELGLADVKFNDQENNFKVCAWSKERMVNTNDNDPVGWDPFPATIEVDPDNDANHVFVCHGKAAITEGDAAAWDNQFWIQSKHSWPAGTTLKIKFRYKASKEVSCQTQIHKQNPSDYLIWHAIGDMSFTETWQTFEKDVTFGDDMGGGWSVAFNLNSSDKDAIDFYFDDLSWQYLKLDEGYFLAGINTSTTTSYDDLDNAIPFEEGVDFDDAECLVATIGEKGNANSYVDQIMIATKRGDDQAFRGSTLKPTSKITAQKEWAEFTTGTNAQIDLPGVGVWTIYLDTEYNTMAVELLEGTAIDVEPIEVFTYAEEITVNGLERDWLPADADGNPQEEQIGEGAAWDNQFFIKANRALKKGEVTKVAFKYKASVAGATSGTQCHGETPGSYMHWGAIGSLTFGEDWEDFEADFTIPNEADGMWNIAFNLAEIKAACDYSFKDIQWYLYDASLDEGETFENLISGSTNFYKKEGAGTNPYTGIENVVKNAKTSNVMYNLAGQRVSKDFKGIVVKDGRKAVLK
jgi:hypothetical protein